MQSMPGVDYGAMLSELSKFGASFILATQSLTKLGDLSLTMSDTVLANVGRLVVFQVAGADARDLVWELGRERVSEDDITSLPVHHCYVRATVSSERMPAFSMKVGKSGQGDTGAAARIREASKGYTTSATELAALGVEADKMVEQFRGRLAEIRNGKGSAPTWKKRRRRRGQPGGVCTDRRSRVRRSE